MQPLRKVTGVLLAAALTAVGIGLAGPSQAASPPATFGGVVGSVPAETPDFANGAVFAVVQLGDTVIVGGSFTAESDDQGAFNQPSLVAYSLSSGRLLRNWTPAVVGTVSALVPNAQGTGVYVAGALSSVNGKGGKLALLNVADGTTVASFVPPAFNGQVNDLALGRSDFPAAGASLLYVAGAFTKAGQQSRGGLASVDASTGKLDGSMTVSLTGHHNYGVNGGTTPGTVGPGSIALDPTTKTRLIVDGNFRTATDPVGSYNRDQIVSLDLSGQQAVVDPNWNTNVYTASCNVKYDSYVRDIAWSPDGSYFVVAATGGYNSTPVANTNCDSATRFDASSTGQSVLPRWTDRTGGDSLYSVVVTDAAVYVGGHQRWLNNDLAKDRAGNGAVPRPGLAALDTRTGVPLVWNPGRNPRGDGAQLLYAGAAGLFVGSDTDYIGNFKYQRGKLAFFPASDSTSLTPPPENTGNASKIYIAGGTKFPFASRTFDPGTGTGGPLAADAAGSTTGLNWANVRGAFMLDSQVWYGMSDGTFWVQPFDGSSFGTAHQVDPYNDPYWATVASGSKTSAGDDIYYAGMKSALYNSMPNVTAMFYSWGYLYYTKSGTAGLYRRAFSSMTAPYPSTSANPQAVIGGVIGTQEVQVASSGFSGIAGLFLANGQLYVAWSDGTLRSVPFVDGAPFGAPQPVAGAGVGWRGKAVFTAP